MADVVFIAVTLVFFALCAGYVRGMDRIVRSAEDADKAQAPSEVHEVSA